MTSTTHDPKRKGATKTPLLNDKNSKKKNFN